MKGVDRIILGYLYKNDTGDFIDVTKAFNSKKSPSKKHIKNTCESLKKYIETESVYNYKELLIIEQSIPVTPAATEPLLKARITQNGREHYLNTKNNSSQTKFRN